MRPVLQSESSECGLACLAMIANHFGYEADLAELRRKYSISLKGATLEQLIRHAAAIQLTARPLRLELEEINQLKCPCILHWDLKHFVVLEKVRRTLNGKIFLSILDPAVGKRKLALTEISRHFTGVALELTPTQHFEKKKPTPQISISQLVGKIIGLRVAVAKALALAVALEVFAIISPLFNQFVVDEVISSNDVELLKVLVFGFAILIVTQTTIGLARSWFLMRWSIEIGFQWTSRVFAHMLRLPIAYFEKRHLGDIVSRFGSIATIQSTLTSLLIESLLDGLMALFAVVMMFVYSVKLSLVVLTSVTFYALLRLIFYQPLREASRERLILASKESSNFLETIRAITPLKLYGREAERLARWQNLKLNVINRDLLTQKIGVLFKSINSVISATQGLMLFYFGADMVMSNVLTIGMLMAFTSYSSTFSGRIFSLIDLVINLRMLRMHADRLSDIVMAEPEPEVEMETDISRLAPRIQLKDVKFRYADGEPWVLKSINLTIPAGQSVAIVGASGCGKTTLCKILLGLLSPTEGDVLIDGIPITKIGLRAFRQIVGTVMQDDILLSGSIQDNIGFFDSTPDLNNIKECARVASVHDEIVAMPMGYQTLVGDMGTGLSGGQKQRILLARALYKKPRILALDEATSNLDVKNERSVIDQLSRLTLTRIIIAHRPETINSAERVVLIEDGHLSEIRPATVKYFTENDPSDKAEKREKA